MHLRPTGYTMRQSALAVALVWCAAGCDMDVPRRGASVRDSAGVRIYQVDTGPPQRLRLTTNPIVSVAPDVPGVYALYRIRDVARLSDESFVVSNNGTELLFFDRTGEYVRTVGRRGEGPGEFLTINNVMRGPGDTLFVFDARLDRLTVIAPSGIVVQTAQLRHDGDGAFYDLLGVTGNGDLVLSDISFIRSSFESGEVSLPFDLHLYHRTSGDVTLIGSYHRAPSYRYVLGNGSTSRSIPFHASPVFALHGDKLFVGIGRQGEVRVQNPPGIAHAVYRLSWEPEPVTEADIERYREERIARARSESRRVIEREIVSAMRFPSHWPFYRDVRAGSDGRIWLRKDGPEVGKDHQQWMSFDSAGNRTRVLEITGDFRLISFGSTSVVGITRDEFDVERIVVHGLETSGGESE